MGRLSRKEYHAQISLDEGEQAVYKKVPSPGRKSGGSGSPSFKKVEHNVNHPTKLAAVPSPEKNPEPDIS